MNSGFFEDVDVDGVEESKDSLGGFNLVDSGPYRMKVKMAYAGKSGAEGSKARSITLIGVNMDDTSQEVRETVWVTNKNNQSYYVRDNKKNPLPGFALADDLALCAAGVTLTQLGAEERTVNIYNYDEGKEVPTNVMVFTDLINKEVGALVTRQTVDKTKKNDASGQYEPTGETREENVFSKFFDLESKKTVSEARNGKPATFVEKWCEKYQGKVVNKARGATGKAGAPGGGGSANSGGSGGVGSTPDLFNRG